VSLIDDIRSRGATMRGRLWELLVSHEYPTDTKSLLLTAYVDIALEHHAAIWLLTEHKLNGSAFALVRTVFDAMLRALWINAVATPEQIEQASRDELNWQRIQVRDDVQHAYFSAAPEDAERPEVVERFPLVSSGCSSSNSFVIGYAFIIE
jgi:Family of unknown function (DUF6988)